jgi:hypothetical protein
VPIVEHWWERTLPTIRTKDFRESWIDFVVAWQRVRSPGEGAILTGVGEWVRAQTDDPLMRLELACEAIQSRQGDQTFFLGCRTAAGLIGTSKSHAAKLLAQLVEARVLRVEKPSDNPQRKAVVYRYCGPSILTITTWENSNE